MIPIDRRRVLKMLLMSSVAALLRGHAYDASAHRASQGNTHEPNVLIFLFDALSARHMSLYGYVRETTSNLARFANRATVYHAHRSAGNFTTPSTASLWTGTYPWRHRAFNQGGLVASEYVQQNLLQLVQVRLMASS